MKINLPKWTNERNIYIFAGIELVIKRDMDKWFVKTERCSQCGKCCKNLKCEHLVFRANEYLCDLGTKRPFDCSVSDGVEDCNIKWQSMENID